MCSVLHELGCSEIIIAYRITETSTISFQSDVNDPVDIRVSTVGRIQPYCEMKIEGSKLVMEGFRVTRKRKYRDVKSVGTVYTFQG